MVFKSPARNFEHHSQISRKAALGFQLSIVVKVLNFVSLFFIVRYMGFEVIGILGYATAFVALINIVGDLGVSTAHWRIVSEEHDIRKCHSVLIILKLLLTLAMVVLFIFWIFFSKYYLDYDFVSNEVEIVIYIILVNQIIQNLIFIFRTAVSAKIRKGAVAIYRLGGNFILTILLCSVAVLGLGVIALATSHVFASSVVLLTVSYFFFRTNKLKKPNKKLIHRYIKIALPVSFLGAISTLLTNIDKLMLGSFVGISLLGQYVIAEKLANLLVILVGGIGGQLFVIFSDFKINKEEEKIRLLSEKAEKYISLSTMPLLILMILFSEEILFIFSGQELGQTSSILILLSLAFYINILRIPHANQIASALYLKTAASITAFAVVLNICLNLVLIPEELYGQKLFGFGAFGAAIASLVTMFVYGILQRFATYQINGTLPYRGLFWHYVAASTSIFIIYYLKNLYFIWYLILPYGIASVFFFFSLLFLFKEFKKSDIFLFWNALHPSKMVKYIREDIKDMEIK